MSPNRSRSSDGTIGDTSHQTRKSDHNPNDDGVVTAMDITHDPAHGVDAGVLAEILRDSEDPRIKYVISNARIFSSLTSPWQWRPYSGANAHTKHVHVSVVGDRKLYDDDSPWLVDYIARVSEHPSSKRCANITATVFGGQADPNRSAYDNHFITDTEFGVALPNRFTGMRPKVRVTNSRNGKSIVCDIVDVGPWNTRDPYWEGNARPQAESGTDLSGRKTNLAGIDLTPAAAHAIDLNGKGKVDWEFADAVAADVSVGAGVPGAAGDSVLIAIKERIDQLGQAISGASARGEPAKEFGDVKMPTPVPTNEVVVLLQQLLPILQGLSGKPADPSAPQQPEQLRKALEILTSIVSPMKSGGPPPLGQVNGALGSTIGNLLNGKKTAIGVIGSVLTSVLSQVPAGTGLGQVLGLLTPAAGLSGFALPIFLAFTAWGALGKMEKWSQGAGAVVPK
jgi:hypothetical protein